MEFLAVLLVGAVVVGLWACLVVGLISAARVPTYAWSAVGRTKAGTIVGIVFTGGVGGVYYLAILRPKLKRATRQPPPATTTRSSAHASWSRD